MKSIVLIGATGDVGQGIARALLARGHLVLAVARNATKLGALCDSLGSDHLVPIAGSVGTEAQARRLLADVRAHATSIDAVVVSINSPRRWGTKLLDLASDDLSSVLSADVVSHFTTARTFIPAIRPGGTYVGIGGGTADFVLPDGAHMSVAQAGLRMMYRALAAELTHPVQLRELIVASVVNGPSTRDVAQPHWVTDDEIGAHVATLVDEPQRYAAPLLRLSRRGQVELIPDPELGKARGGG